MLTAEARIQTERASRYLDQLCRHVSQMGQHRAFRLPSNGGHAAPEVQHVEWADTHGTIDLGWGRCVVEAGPDLLTLHLEATDEERLQRLQSAVAHRLETISRRDGLTVNWQRADATDGAAPVSHRLARKRPGRATTTGMVIAGLLIVAAHLGVFGTAVELSMWTGWATNIFLALVLLKVLGIVAHVVLGGVLVRHPAVRRVVRRKARGAGK